MNVVNDAADVIGLSPFSSLNEGDAPKLQRQVEQEAEAAFSSHSWGWASQSERLADSAKRSPYQSDWVIRPRPVGMKRLMYVFYYQREDWQDTVRYNVDNEGIHCESGELWVRFVRERDIGGWPVEFAKYIAARAANELAPLLRPASADNAFAIMQQRFAIATKSDNIERGQNSVLFDSERYVRQRGFWGDESGDGYLGGRF